jgi:hypothetical protein
MGFLFGVTPELVYFALAPRLCNGTLVDREVWEISTGVDLYAAYAVLKGLDSKFDDRD